MKNNIITLALGLLLAYFAVQTVSLSLDLIIRSQQITKIDALPDFKALQDYTVKDYPALIRIESVGSKSRFECSGTVISDDYVLTAAHCISNARGNLSKNKVRIVSLFTKGLTSFEVEGTPATLNSRADYGLIKGDFKRFTKLPIQLNLELFAYEVGQKGLVFCGFPWGSKNSVCYPMTKIKQSDFGFIGDGLIYPGMSGGPVIDPLNNKVVAVNSAVGATGMGVVVSPLIGFFDNLGVKVVQ